MRTNIVKKGLVFGIIILFVGSSFVPSISGYIGKTSNQLIKEPAVFPLTNNYTLAYWKFDETSGNIAHDSSGHGYDGTVYGATWTGSGLDFDGVDDYVDLDAHAQNLGFNKTDDLIFSFWFKSSQNTLGRIYSTSSDTGTNPEVQIFLAPNGTIGFKIRATNCGFEVYSNAAYNDNNWHYVEIWYNGITNEPTVTIYVDNVFDKNITEWVCPFYNDEFTLTNIGKRSNNATDFFDGIIDEFKIIKFPGGNQPPTIDILFPQNMEPGVEYRVRLSCCQLVLLS